MTARPPSAFRLNLEQQKTRAKELLRAARAGDASALSRLARIRRKDPLKLADAQLAIARELRFGNWAELKSHIASLDRQRDAIDRGLPAPDSDMKTLHLRCGSDIQITLEQAGFVGDFLEHAVPYCLGPVTSGSDRHEQMARFIIDTFPEVHGGLTCGSVLEGLKQGEQLLHRSAEEYERVVMWMEHDSWDQLVLARLLAHYAVAKRPRVLELVAVSAFPGGDRFRGLGQLPAEALRLLWDTRTSVTPEQLSLGSAAWSALSREDPRELAALMRSGTPALPMMAPALQRHLQELPATANGLSLSEQLILETLSDGSLTQGKLLGTILFVREPLPWNTDLGMLHIIDDMLSAAEPVLLRSPHPPEPGQDRFKQVLTLTELGLAVLRGERDWHTLMPPPRWVGGVHVLPGSPGWRWSEARRDVVLRI
jgi:hypothetical protein